MKQWIMSTLILLTSMSCFAQDQTLNLSAFNNLYASTSVDIELIQSDQNKAEVNIIKGDPDQFKISDSGNTLKIYWKSNSGNNWNNNRKAEVTLYYTDLESIDVSAGANVYGKETMKVEDFEARVDSGGRLDLVLEANEIEVDVNSGGNFTAEGTANKLEVDANSGGYFKGKKLEVSHVDAHANSGGNAKVWATSSIKASANSGGNVSYKGEPTNKKIKKDKWSGGSVRKI